MDAREREEDADNYQYSVLLNNCDARTAKDPNKKCIRTEYYCFIKTNFSKCLAKKNDIEMNFLKLGNLWEMAHLIVFFMLCDSIFCPGQRLTSIYSLMFYNVIAYCISYIYTTMCKQKYTPFVFISETARIRHLSLTATKLVLDLTKAVSFVVTVVFTLLLLGLEQKLEHYQPTFAYALVTAAYFILTQKYVRENSQIIVEKFRLEYLEGLERLWTPVLIQAALGTLSLALAVERFLSGNYTLAAFALYCNVYLRLKGSLRKAWTELKSELTVLSKYRMATRQEISKLNDICAVCLQPMHFARFTPCNHMFHGDCLKLCLKENNNCPLCKQIL